MANVALAFLSEVDPRTSFPSRRVTAPPGCSQESCSTGGRTAAEITAVCPIEIVGASVVELTMLSPQRLRNSVTSGVSYDRGNAATTSGRPSPSKSATATLPWMMSKLLWHGGTSGESHCRVKVPVPDPVEVLMPQGAEITRSRLPSCVRSAAAIALSVVEVLTGYNSGSPNERPP